MSRIRSSLALLVGCVWALGLAGTAALAADMSMPVKAPPPPPPPPSWWSGFIEVVYENGQVNPQGQAVYRDGDIHVVAGVNLNLYNDKTGFINKHQFGGLAILDYVTESTWGPSDAFWASNNPTQGGAALYYILAVDASVSFAQYWTLADTFFLLNVLQSPTVPLLMGTGCSRVQVVPIVDDRQCPRRYLRVSRSSCLVLERAQALAE